MLDIKLVRGEPERVKADLRKRGRDPQIVDRLLHHDKQWREGQVSRDRLRALYNKGSVFIGTLKGQEKEFAAINLDFERTRAAIQKFRVHHSKPDGFLKAVAGAFSSAGEPETYFGSLSRLSGILLAVPTRIAYVIDKYNRFCQEAGLTPDTTTLNSLQWYADSIKSDSQWLSELQKDSNALAQAKISPDSRHLQLDSELGAKPYAELNTLATNVRTLVQGGIGFFQQLSADLAGWEAHVSKSIKARDDLHRSLPNLMHPDVPVGKDDSENREVRAWGGKPVHAFPGRSHVDLLESLDVADLERAARAAGARFVYLKGDLVLLGRALEFFALTELAKKGFTAIEPPYLLRREAMEGAVDLADFESVIYKVEAEAKEPPLYLIATSEHPIAAMHMGEILEAASLPLKYAGVSPCFRKEAGAHGKDTKGIFRVHQFSKVEQFVFCRPEESWAVHEQLVRNAEDLYRQLGIPHRVVDICTGDLGSIAARKYDVEAWMPVQGAYREVVSCSNCTDFQARRYNTRFRPKAGEDTQFVHTLNSTAIAVQRTLVAILENFQQADGSVAIPEPLRPYMGGKERIEPRLSS